MTEASANAHRHAFEADSPARVCRAAGRSHAHGGAGRLPRLALLVLCLPVTALGQAAGTDIDALAAELAELRERLAELETLRDRVAELEVQLAEARTGSIGPEGGSMAVPEFEEEPGDGVTLGGALRFNLYWNDYQEPVEETRGVGAFDLFRIGGEGSIGDFLLSAEYRFYSYMNVLHHGWVGYEFDDDARLEFGVTR
ncbi:MAG: hypothetical protein P8172_11740, partial [Gammaproteobacteria bacterium]